MDEVFRNKGIDTTYEREKIDYRPHLEYKKAYVPPAETAPGEHIETIYERDMLAADIVEYLEQTKVKTDELVALIEHRLDVDVIPLGDEEAALIGMAKITFHDYKNALDAELDGNASRQSQLITQFYEDYHGYNIEGLIDVELYRGMRLSQIDGNSACAFFKKTFIELMGDDLVKFETSRLNNWDTLLDRQYQLGRSIRERLNLQPGEVIEYDSLSDKFTDSTVGEDVREYEKITAQTKAYNNDPILSIKQLGRRKLETWNEYISNTKSNLLSTVNDFLGGGAKCLILRAIGASRLRTDMENANLGEIRTYLRTTYTVLTSIETLLKVNVVDTNQLSKTILNSLIELIKGPLQNVLNNLVAEVAKRRAKIINGVDEWLDDIDDTDYCFSFDLLANFVVDGIASIEKKLVGWLAELYKIITFQDELNKDSSSNHLQKQRIRSTYKVIKQVKIIIGEILSKLDDLEFNDIDGLINLAIEQHGWDRSYDPVSDSVINNKREKLHDFAGGI